MTSRITLYEPLSRPIATPKLSRHLRELNLMKDILRTPCQVTLTQQRYEKVERTSQFTLRSGDHTAELYLCLLNSILFHLTQSQHDSCMGGYLQIVIRNSRIISSASVIRVPKIGCALMYVPIYVTEIHTDAQQGEAEEAKQRQQTGRTSRWFCRNCAPGHAMGLFIDKNTKTLQVYDSNGTISDYYRKIVDWIERRLENQWKSGFPGYRVLADLEVPQFGIQTNTNIAQCAYFSTLYAALRLQNPRIPPLELNRLMLEIPRREIKPILNRWHCYLIGYAKDHGILQRFEHIKPLFEQVFMRLINYQFYRLNLSKEQVKNYWKIMQSLASFSDTNILKAYTILQQLADQL